MFTKRTSGYLAASCSNFLVNILHARQKEKVISHTMRSPKGAGTCMATVEGRNVFINAGASESESEREINTHKPTKNGSIRAIATTRTTETVPTGAVAVTRTATITTSHKPERHGATRLSSNQSHALLSTTNEQSPRSWRRPGRSRAQSSIAPQSRPADRRLERARRRHARGETPTCACTSHSHTLFAYPTCKRVESQHHA